MAILQKLTELGFKADSVGKDVNNTETVRIRTSKGWTYQRFTHDEEVDMWAKYHKPEE